MKHTILLSVIISVFAVLFPAFASIGKPLAVSEENVASKEENIFKISEDDIQAEEEKPIDDTITVKVLHNDEVYDMEMGDYLVGVLSGEMPASFEKEALKAQAVAARTYTVYRMYEEPASSHPEANVCTDSACCKAYSSLDTLKEKWGEDFESYLSKISDAVKETDGICITYENEPILAVFHSSSSGMTENSEEVWGSALPYLKSVESMENTEEVPKYDYTVTVSDDDFVDTMKGEFQNISFTDDPDEWFSDAEYSESGRLSSINICGESVKGTKLRSMFGLRSSHIDIEVKDGDILFTTAGYGHGVGMSQYGANSLAKDGYTYEEILSWYYTDISLKSINDLNIN